MAITKDLASARNQYLVRSILHPLAVHRHPDWSKFHAVVFESDDWGLCGEGKDKGAHEHLASLGHDMHSRRSRRLYDNTLETAEDLHRLYGTLSSFKDSIGRHPIFTANFIVSNPSFEAIRKSRFRSYHSIPITKGFPGSWNLRNTSAETWLHAWQQGIKRKLIVPEYHGLSHFNSANWIAGIRKGDKKLTDFFEEEMFSTSNENPTIAEYGVAASPYRWYLEEQVQYQQFEEQYSNIMKGTEIFMAAFGRHPRTTIPPHDISNWKSWVGFAKAGFGHLQSDRRKISSMLGLNRLAPKTAFEAIRRILLQLTIIDRLYRNVRLENEERDGSGLLELSDRIFRLGSPVIVGTHRQNYVAGVDPSSADLGIRRLESYLGGLCEDPNLVFLSSYEAFQLASNGRSIEILGDEIIIRNYTRSDVKMFVQGTGRQTLSSAPQGNANGAHLQTVDTGTKVYVPAGRVMILTSESSPTQQM
jgi:hypothetical protein